MNLVVISPEHDDARELALLPALFAAGLTRYHLRKPGWSRDKLRAWLSELPAAWRSRVVLHQQHEYVHEFGLGGRHWRDDDGAPATPPRDGKFASRSCHDLTALRAALGRYDAVFFGPVFPSRSKPGHGPRPDFSPADIASLLTQRGPAERQTSVIALGGIAPENAAHALSLGFDGVAVLGALWQSPDPLRVFNDLQSSLACHAA